MMLSPSGSEVVTLGPQGRCWINRKAFCIRLPHPATTNPHYQPLPRASARCLVLPSQASRMQPLEALKHRRQGNEIAESAFLASSGSSSKSNQWHH